MQLIPTADEILLPYLCWGIGNIAAKWDNFYVSVDAPAVLKVLVQRLADENFSEATFQLVVGDITYALRSIVSHGLSYESIQSTLLLFTKLIKNWQQYPRRAVYNALSGIKNIAIHNNERAIGLLLCISEWECVQQMVVILDKEKTDDPITREDFSHIIADAVYYQEDDKKIANLVESNLLGVFFTILKANPRAAVKYHICITIANLCVDQHCRTILNHTDLIRMLVEVFPTVQKPIRREICFILNLCLEDEEILREHSNSLVECGLLEYFCHVVQRKIHGNLLEQALQCLKRVLHIGEFLVDNENILFNEYVLRFGEKGGREILMQIASNENNLYAGLPASIASGILTSFFGSKYEEFCARKRGFKIKKAL